MSDVQDPRLLAAVKMLERTGARDFSVAYTDEHGTPVVWYAICRWSLGPEGKPVASGGTDVWETAAAMDPLKAVLRLCGQVVDGGVCAHCGKTTIFEPELDDMLDPYKGVFCLYAWDPELATFRRDCEGN